MEKRVKETARWAMTADIEELKQAIRKAEEEYSFGRRMGAVRMGDKEELEAMKTILNYRID